MRALTSYYRVQLALSKVMRNRSFQLWRSLKDKEYLDVGCGLNQHPEFVNLDYVWMPGVDVCWDITSKPYPFPEGRFKGIFTEHCLEHISFAACERNIKEFHRILAPGGRLRIVVPDGELLMDIYHERRHGGTRRMPHEKGYLSMMQCINGVFRNHGHQFIYDFETFKILLERHGFRHVEKAAYLTGQDAALLNDTASRSEESLYVEAVK